MGYMPSLPSVASGLVLVANVAGSTNQKQLKGENMKIVKFNNQAIEIPALHEQVRTKAGGFITFKDYAALSKVNLADKEEKKKASKAHALARREFFAVNKRIAAAAVADARFDARNFRVVTDADGNVKGADIKLREPSKADQKIGGSAAAKLAEKDKELATLREELAALRAALPAPVTA
jgi:hypothetical protein